jgi:hypothetical protein
MSERKSARNSWRNTRSGSSRRAASISAGAMNGLDDVGIVQHDHSGSDGSSPHPYAFQKKLRPLGVE